jgi:hypothetical protein
MGLKVVSPGSRQALNKSPFNGRTRLSHDNGDGVAHLLDYVGRVGTFDNNDLDLVTMEQFGREIRQSLKLALRKPVLDGDAPSLNPTEVTQSLSERFEKALGIGQRSRTKEPNPVSFPLLLTVGPERRKDEAENENDREPDPPHGHLVGMAGGV